MKKTLILLTFSGVIVAKLEFIMAKLESNCGKIGVRLWQNWSLNVAELELLWQNWSRIMAKLEPMI